MFSFRYKRNLIVLLLLFPIIMSPSAIADDPTTNSILDRTLCESWGATWKNTSCNVSISVYTPTTNFEINAKTTLIINKGVNFYSFGNVINNGSIRNFGVLVFSRKITNNGFIHNFGSLNFQGEINLNQVQGKIINNSVMFWYSGLFNSGKLINNFGAVAYRYQYTENSSTGIINNEGEWNGGCVDRNFGIVNGVCVSP